jgi:hypothetical protein
MLNYIHMWAKLSATFLYIASLFFSPVPKNQVYSPTPTPIQSAPKATENLVTNNNILGTMTANVRNTVINLNKVISCVGPDNKIAIAPKRDCDAVWVFWLAHPPAKPQSSSQGSSNSSNSNNSGSSNSSSQEDTAQPTPTVAPVPTETPTPTASPTPTITSTPVPQLDVSSVSIAPCMSESCSSYWTVTVSGSNFTLDSRMSLRDLNGIVYSEKTAIRHNPDMQYVGGSESQIHTDVYYPVCGWYNVIATDPVNGSDFSLSYLCN